MKILFSLTYYTPYVSGLTLYVKRLTEVLVNKDCQVKVLTMQFDKKLSTHEFINDVEVIRAGTLVKLSKGFISIDWLFQSISQVKSSDTVVVSLPQFEGLVPAVLAKVFNKKLISIYHCEVVLPEGVLNKIIEKILNWSNYLTLQLSDQIVTYTEDFAKHSIILPRFSYKIKYIYPPIIKPKVDRRVQKMIRDKLELEHYFVIGVAARLAAEKGIEYLFEALPQIDSHLSVIPTDPDSIGGVEGSLTTPKIKIVIAGPLEPVGERAYKEKIMKLVEKYKDYVVFLGELKEEEMGSFYSLLDLLVLPSVNSTEAFGMVQVEAMMMGVPVVSTDLPGVRVPIQKTGMGISVPIKNSQKLSKAIVEILLNKKKYTKNKEMVKKEFSFEKTIEFYEKLFS